MGAWGWGNFENDDARDWVGYLTPHNDLTPVIQALASVTDAEKNQLDATQAARGLAALEVLAALRGAPAGGLPEEIAAWIAGKTPPANKLVEQGKKALQRILRDSELRDLWADSDVYRAWIRHLQSLSKRLSAPPRKPRSGKSKRKQKLTFCACWFCGERIAWDELVQLKVMRYNEEKPPKMEEKSGFYAHDLCRKKAAHPSIGKDLFPELFGTSTPEAGQS